MKYLFILGRNEELSQLEIIEFLKKEENTSIETKKIQNGLLVSVKKELKSGTIRRLGGTISIGKVLIESDKKDLSKELSKIMVYSGTKNSLNYALWNFPSENDWVNENLKKRFKEEKLRATLKNLNKEVTTQNGEKEFIPSSKLLDEEFFSFTENEKTLFGRLTQKNDYENIEKRDDNKPIHRPSLDISIRLAKILINISGIKKGETLYDPFCGIGTILQEALLQEIKTVGVDKDKDAILGAEKNLEWFNFNKENYTLINFDSTKVNLPEINCLVTEPDLGMLLKKTPTKEKAKQMLKGFEKLIIRVINNSKNKLSGRVAFTSPYIRIGKKRIHCNIESICEKTGYKLHKPGIEEFRNNQVVGRMIYVLTKEQ